MNISLLLKWWWKLKDSNFHSLWKDLFLMKYGNSRNTSKFSAFWKDIVSLTSLGNISSYYRWGNGINIKFWSNVWLGDCSLATAYPQLYSMVSNKEITLHEVIQHQGKNISFSRTLTGMLQHDWYKILSIIPAYYCNLPDQIRFRWNTSGNYTTKDMYEFINFREIWVTDVNIWWATPIPHNGKIFMWLAHNGKILTKDNLTKKGWIGNLKCCFCDQEKTISHLFLTCKFTCKLWFWMGTFKDIFTNWHSFEDVLTQLEHLSQIEVQAFLSVFSAVCWSVWLIRNNICFNPDRQNNITVRNILMQIFSTVDYWMEGIHSNAVKLKMYQWLPYAWDEVPIQEAPPVAALAPNVETEEMAIDMGLTQF